MVLESESYDVRMAIRTGDLRNDGFVGAHSGFADDFP
jgi:hypothetical protein